MGSLPEGCQRVARELLEGGAFTPLAAFKRVKGEKVS